MPEGTEDEKTITLKADRWEALEKLAAERGETVESFVDKVLERGLEVVARSEKAMQDGRAGKRGR
jgi:hypothetical protein